MCVVRRVCRSMIATSPCSNLLPTLLARCPSAHRSDHEEGQDKTAPGKQTCDQNAQPGIPRAPSVSSPATSPSRGTEQVKEGPGILKPLPGQRVAQTTKRQACAKSQQQTQWTSARSAPQSGRERLLVHMVRGINHPGSFFCNEAMCHLASQDT